MDESPTAIEVTSKSISDFGDAGRISSFDPYRDSVAIGEISIASISDARSIGLRTRMLYSSSLEPCMKVLSMRSSPEGRIR